MDPAPRPRRFSHRLSVRISADGIKGKATANVSAQVDINFPNGLGQLRRLLLTSAAITGAAGVVVMGNSKQTTVGWRQCICVAGDSERLPAVLHRIDRVRHSVLRTCLTWLANHEDRRADGCGHEGDRELADLSDLHAVPDCLR